MSNALDTEKRKAVAFNQLLRTLGEETFKKYTTLLKSFNSRPTVKEFLFFTKMVGIKDFYTASVWYLYCYQEGYEIVLKNTVDFNDLDLSELFSDFLKSSEVF